MAKIKVMSIFGTRPEAIKMAPLVLELENRKETFESRVVITAQHREMLDQVLGFFEIKADYDLNMMAKKQTLSDITAKALRGLDEILEKEAPDIILVHGDTSTTFAGALSAFYHQVKIGHVEAGLRTYNKYSPYPEEMNRQLTGVLADIHFAPTEKAKQYLLAEKKPDADIVVTGNTSIDTLKLTTKASYQHPALSEDKDKKLVLLTAHRRENIGKNLENIFRAIKRLVEAHEDIYVVYPVHLNPSVKETAENILGEIDRVKLISPLDVVDFHNFMQRAYLILTDSGGIQEEAPGFGVPVLVLRDTTERPEGVDAGTLKLTGTNEEDIYRDAHLLLTDASAYQKMAKSKNPYGDGTASKQIVDYLEKYFQ